MSNLLNLILLTCAWLVFLAGSGFYKRAKAVVLPGGRHVFGFSSGGNSRCRYVTQFHVDDKRSSMCGRGLKQI